MMHFLIFRRALGVTLGLALLAGLRSAPARAQTYTLTDLGTLGGLYSHASGVNNSGQVTGYAYTSSGLQHAFLSGASGGTLKDLSTLGGSTSTGSAVNDRGQVVGSSDVNGRTEAFLSGVDGGSLKGLGGLGGGYSGGGGVNSQGQVAGDSATADYNSDHVFLSGPDGMALKDVGTLPGAYHINATGVNDAGQITGYGNDGRPQAYLSAPGGGGLKRLGTLPGGDSSYADGVNAAGQVVGFSNLSVDGVLSGNHAFLSGPDGGALTDLGTLGGAQSYGQAVNDLGQAVGGYTFEDIPSAPLVYHASLFAGGQMKDLNSLIAPGSGFTLNAAYGISDTDFIAGEGTTAAGFTHAFLLTPLAPVPEGPTTASFGLLVLGLAGLMTAAGRWKKATAPP